MSTFYKAPNFWISQLPTSMKILKSKIAFFVSVGVSASRVWHAMNLHSFSNWLQSPGLVLGVCEKPTLTLNLSGTNLFFCPSFCPSSYFVSSFSWLYHLLFLCFCFPFFLPMPLSTSFADSPVSTTVFILLYHTHIVVLLNQPPLPPFSSTSTYVSPNPSKDINFELLSVYMCTST